MTLPVLPRAPTRLPIGRENVPIPSLTELSTTRVPVKIAPGMDPDRTMSFDVPSISRNVNGPGNWTTGTEVVTVTITLPATVGEGSLSAILAVGATVPTSVAPMSHARPLRGRLSA